ncbi:MAG: hypothetical protein JOZ05_13955 [Acetobacteraceae bacterium]|nr:hypothetical protein [Acetobacteraceae bacterium]
MAARIACQARRPAWSPAASSSSAHCGVDGCGLAVLIQQELRAAVGVELVH